MEPSLALVPGLSTNAPAGVSVSDSANSLGLHDAMRYGTRSIASETGPKHALQQRLEKWDDTRENLDMTLQRNMYGLHAPVRQMMERQIVSQTPTPLTLGGFTRSSNFSLDILKGEDETIKAEDVLTDRIQSRELGNFHVAMERKLRMM